MRLLNKRFLGKVFAWALTAAVATTTALSGFSPLDKVTEKVTGKESEKATVTAEAASSDILSADDRGVIYSNSRTDFRDESIYFVITTRFYDGDSSNNTTTSEDTKAKNPASDPSWRGDFAGLIEQLDYIKALGFTAIWITPVVTNNSGYDYHGYHAYDFSAVDTRYESNGVTYQTLIDAAHAKGMKIIQDVVFNHTCNWGEVNLKKMGGSTLATQLESNVYSERNQVVMSGTYDPLNIYHHNGFCGGGDWDNYEAQRKTIADDCFDLETENPTVYNYLVDCYKKYIDMGVDGFRVDTVKHISRLTLNKAILPALQTEAESNGNSSFYMFGEVCTKGHDVWYRDAPPISTCFYTWDTDSSYKSQWSETDLSTNEALVEQHYTDNLSTSSQPTSDNAFLSGNTYHTPDYSKKSDLGVIDFQMHWSFNSASEAFATALGEDKYFNDSTWNVVYVDSHDYAPDNCQTVRYTGGTDAWAENLSLMFTFRGIPCLYYGSEIEFQAGKPIDVGPNSPLSETGRAYYGDHLEGNVDTTDFTEFGNLSGEVENTLKSTLSQHIMRLNRLRQAIPALRKGQYSTDGCSGNMCFKRRYTDSTTDSFALVTISGGATFTGIPNGTYVDAVTGDTQTVSNGTLKASCSGKANMRVYVLNTSLTPAPGRVIPNGDYLTDGGSAVIIDNGTISVVEPTSISVSSTSVSVKEAESTTVTATVLPSDASQIVKWTSSDTSIATVSSGKITGVSVGTATITATTSNGLTATVKVKVVENPNIIKPTGISLNKTSLSLYTRSSETLTATVTPSNTTYPDVTWTSSNSSVASVDAGKVTGVSAGTATITATTTNGLTASCTVTVEKNTNNTVIYFKNTSSWASPCAYAWSSTESDASNASWPGEAMTLVEDDVYSIELSADVNYDKIIFNNNGSSQTADLTLGSNGQIYDYSTSTWSDYEVGDKVAVTGVSLNKTSASLEAGNSLTLTATVTPSNATTKTVTWTSSNSSVATVSGGVVTGKSAGTTTITVTTKDGGYTATCVVTVSGTVDTGKTYYLKNAAGWSQCAAYTWVSGTNNADASWPGTVMTLVDSSEAIYSITLDDSSSSNMIIFNNGSGTQTSDLSIPTDGTNMYNNSTGTWSTYNPTVAVTGVTLNKTTATIDAGASTTLTATVAPSNATNQNVTWKSSNTSVATVSNGVVTGVAAGKATITVTTEDGSYKATCTVTVNKNEEEAIVNTSFISQEAVVGEKIVFKGSATGGSGEYQYAYYYRKTSDKTWTTAGTEWGTSAYATAKPGSNTVYEVCIKVRDANNTSNVVKKYLSFAANTTETSLKCYGSVYKTIYKYGITNKITASSANASGTVKYKYEYRKASSWTYETIKDYTTSTSVSWDAPQTGSFTLRITAYDGTDYAIRTINIKVKK